VFATHEEAKAQVREDLETTKEVVTDAFGIPTMVFRRTQWDKFPGGVNTFAADTLMPDGKVLQLPSTHDLGDNFARAFDIKYVNEGNETVYAFQTCYGPAISRIYGALISVHGDDNGLRLPFKLAPYQVVIVPILKGSSTDDVTGYCQKIEKTLRDAGIRVYLDSRDATPGWKYNYWEMKGVPIRVEAGQREVKQEKVVLFRRDLMKREAVPLLGLAKKIQAVGADYDRVLRAEAESRFENLIVDAETLGALEDALDRGKIGRVQFCTTETDGLSCADEIKNKIGGEVRGTRIDVDERATGTCIVCGKAAEAIVYIARSY
jgi:prolyl-tRNA synthetase